MKTDDATYTPKVYENISYLYTTLWGQQEVFPRAESNGLREQEENDWLGVFIKVGGSK